MIEARPPRSPGVPVGYALAAALVLLSAASIYLLFNRPITLLSFFLSLLILLSAPAVAFLLYWTAALSGARYRLTADSLQIAWGPLRYELPLNDVEPVDAPAQEARLEAFRGLRWPGYLLGRGRLVDNRRAPVTFFAAQPPPDVLLVTFNEEWYGLSPQDPGAFREALTAARSNLSPEAGRTLKQQGWLSWPLWRDRTARILLLAAPLLNALHFAVLAGLFPTLPGEVPLRMDNAGAVLLSGPPSRLFLPPLFGLLSWLTNAVLGWNFYHRRHEPTIAYLLWGAAVVLQIAALATLLFLLP
ncbi:MAG: PH domain-containing protein [Chloroflexota bacterium]